MAGLARCVGDVERFLRLHWARAPLYRQHADAGDFADLLSLADVDTMVSTWLLRLPSFRLVRDGAPVDPSRYTKSSRLGGKTVSGVGDPGAIYDEFAAGASIVFQGLHRSWPPLTRFCRQLELEVTHPVQVDAYITPPRSRGLGVHYDTHDVFVLQVAGHKEWQVYDPVLPDPLPSQPWARGMDGADRPMLAVELSPGDSLYVPRGFLHSARSREDVSAHLTVGVLTQTWYDAVRELVSGLPAERRFRQPLPVGYAHDEAVLASELADRLVELRQWLEKADVGALAATLARRFWSSRPPRLTGQLQQLLALDQVTDASGVAVREGAVCRLYRNDDSLSMLLGDRELLLPLALEPVLARIVDGGPFRVGDLADQLDEASRLVLVRRLVREGVLEIEGLG